MKKLLALLLLFPSIAFAGTPAYKVCSNGINITAKQKCAHNEYTLDLSSFKGLQGAQGSSGVQGISGTFDPNKCLKRESQSTGSAVVTATTVCLVNEIMVTTGCTSTSPLSYIRDSSLNTGSNSLYPNLYDIFTCTIEDTHGNQHTVTAQAMCCKP